MTPSGSEFLLAEFNALHQRASDFENQKMSRVNFLLVVVAASVAIMPVMVQQFNAYDWVAVAFVSTIILLIGIATLFQTVEYSVSIAVFYRRAGRIRRWFVDNDPSLTPYLAFPPRDDRPFVHLSGSYLLMRGADAIVVVVNSMAAATIGVMIIGSTIAASTPVFQVVAGVLIGVLSGFMQVVMVNRQLRRRSKALARQVHFPITDSLYERYGNPDKTAQPNVDEIGTDTASGTNIE